MGRVARINSIVWRVHRNANQRLNRTRHILPRRFPSQNLSGALGDRERSARLLKSGKPRAISVRSGSRRPCRSGFHGLRSTSTSAKSWKRLLAISARQRVLQLAEKTPQLQTLKSMAQNTDPFELSREIDQQLDCLNNLKADYQDPQPSGPALPRPAACAGASSRSNSDNLSSRKPPANASRGAPRS